MITANVVDAPESRSLEFTKKKWVAEHLAQRIDAALNDPNVDMVTFVGLLQTYNKHLLTLKRSRHSKGRAA
jgi:hypothetical protein